MQLTDPQEFVTLPPAHDLYVEKTGPFSETAMPAWMEAQKMLEPSGAKGDVIGSRSLFRMKPEMVYCAGFLLSKKLDRDVAGASYLDWPGGRFAKFTMRGSYASLGAAWGKVMEASETLRLDVREGYYVENYVNDPSSTLEDRHVTELLVPVH